MKILDRYHTRRKARRRDKKQIHRYLGSDVLLVSHGKSGRTWVRTLLSHLYHQRYGIAHSQLINYDNFHLQNPDIPKIYFTGDITAPAKSARNGVVFPSPGQRVLLLVRDPRDIAVSYYFQLAKRSTPVEKLRKGIGDEIATIPMFEFVIDETLGIPHIIELMNGWEGHLDRIRDHLLIKYEDLRSDPIAVLSRISEFIGGGFTSDQIERAVSFASFESLKEKERQGFFDSERLRPSDSADPESFKVRRGKVGGYKDYFTMEQLETIDRIVDSQLSPFYRYGSEP